MRNYVSKRTDRKARKEIHGVLMTLYAPLFSNNARRRHGLKPHRKLNKGKRFLTRCEAIETTDALFQWWDQ